MAGIRSISINSIVLMAIASGWMGCSVHEPTPENVPELITRATLTFTPAPGSSGVVVKVTATDPDNIGPKDIQVDGPIQLTRGVQYSMTITLFNDLYAPTDPGYNVSDNVQKHGEEHQFFFSWTAGLFDNPEGNGNIDNRNDPLNYTPPGDVNGRPIGLITAWLASSIPHSGDNTFRVLLKHQPGLKSDTSSSGDGETDLDLTFVIVIL